MDGPKESSRLGPGGDPVLITADKVFDIEGVEPGTKFSAHGIATGADGKLHLCGSVTASTEALDTLSLDVRIDDKTRPAVVVDGELTVIQDLPVSAFAREINRDGQLIITHINSEALVSFGADDPKAEPDESLGRWALENLDPDLIDRLLDQAESIDKLQPLEKKTAHLFGAIFNYLATPSIQTGGYTYEPIEIQKCGFNEKGEIEDLSRRPFAFFEYRDVEQRVAASGEYLEVDVIGRVPGTNYYYGNAQPITALEPAPYVWDGDSLQRFALELTGVSDLVTLDVWKVEGGVHYIVVHDRNEKASLYAGTLLPKAS